MLVKSLQDDIRCCSIFSTFRVKTELKDQTEPLVSKERRGPEELRDRRESLVSMVRRVPLDRRDLKDPSAQKANLAIKGNLDLLDRKEQKELKVNEGTEDLKDQPEHQENMASEVREVPKESPGHQEQEAQRGGKVLSVLRVLKVDLDPPALLVLQELKGFRVQRELKARWGGPDPLGRLENPQGLSGLDGLLGVEGNEGDQGDVGFRGAPGAPGRPGKTGNLGSPGIRGNTGAGGFKGKTGPKGKHGPPGPAGPKGVPGLRGEKGGSGRAGTKGLPGDGGVLGPIGPPGLKGNPGLQGLKGQTGPKGKQGDAGPRGPRGQKGLLGITGRLGKKGLKGARGSRGPKGVKGKRGAPGKPGPAPRLGSIPARGPGLRVEQRPETRPSARNSLKAAQSSEKTPVVLKRKQPRTLSRRLSEEDEAEESFSWPSGTRDDPGTTCHELRLVRPHLNDGYFYMDPNQGCPYDAVKVFCNFTAGGTTCIDPLHSQIKIMREPEMEASKFWSTQQNGGNKFEYTGVDVVQLRFLRLHSHTSFQRITLSCAANRSSAATAGRIIHLMGDSGEEIDSQLITVSRKDCEVDVIVRVRGSTELHRGDMELLPVRDLAVKTSSVSNLVSEVSVVLGPLCFL
ncbi:collagen alpha-3(V) chain-like [Stegastes partitus]|uniref:Collagen alpha-3(V) chain-like n=1 Tax=Stegastes partitus TaxID=144197 RepID=A0A9Y4KH57_9TELE|nr:PREDICTED: collagen alpha-3(V) chain-like [Stegastes partitus]